MTSSIQSTLYIVANVPSEGCKKMRDAVYEGAKHFGEDIIVVAISPDDFNIDQLENVAGFIIGTTENFGYMSGLIKDWFERIYYTCMEQFEGLPVALYVKAGNDGSGAVRSIVPIIKGLRWKLTQEPIICTGAITEDVLQQCRELGGAMAVGLDTNIF